ncbi:MAG: hypothetical protein R3C16_06195 [Hyphomonadaceae bacterium]
MSAEAKAVTEARRLQWLIAFVFLEPGRLVRRRPGERVVSLCFRAPYQSDAPIVLVAIGAFGACAMLAGLFAAFSGFTRLDLHRLRRGAVAVLRIRLLVLRRGYWMTTS